MLTQRTIIPLPPVKIGLFPFFPTSPAPRTIHLLVLANFPREDWAKLATAEQEFAVFRMSPVGPFSLFPQKADVSFESKRGTLPSTLSFFSAHFRGRVG